MLRRGAKKIYAFVLSLLPDAAAVRFMYACRFRKWPDLKNPQTFNEKIAWRKLSQHHPLFPVFSDKLAVKAEAARLIGPEHVIETLWSGDTPEDIPFETLPFPYVIKANHSSGKNFFIRTPQDIDRQEIIAALRKQLSYNHGRTAREWGYVSIPRKVFAERLIESPGSLVPDDYKFFVYHGRVHFIQVNRGRYKDHKLNMYDRDWTLLPCTLEKYPGAEAPEPKPPALDEMIALAEKMGALFDFVRVDLYAPPQGVFFGEATFYPNGGLLRFVPKEWDMAFGKPWKLEHKA